MGSRWWSLRALALHAALLAWTAGCGVATWWQVTRAIGGNQFSYLYAVEWPVFAVAGAACWWALLHSTPAEAKERARRREDAERRQRAEFFARRERAEEDPELAAYNDHLAALAASGKRKGWRG